MNCFVGILLLFSAAMTAQGTVSGTVNSEARPLLGVAVSLDGERTTTTDPEGAYRFADVPPGRHELTFVFEGWRSEKRSFEIADSLVLDPVDMKEKFALDEVVVTGTMKPVSRIESAVPVEIYRPSYFKKNPTPNVFEALQNVNGVRPQLNCNICNTGDIHINGLEGPYTLVLIDGMPIVSGLSTVYGLSGIPNSLLDHIEVVKGPASSLYGSEAVGGLINIITKTPGRSPLFSADGYTTSWGEANFDASFKARISEKTYVLTGLNYFNYSKPIDDNHDGFTDVTLQDRISVFQKWHFDRKDGKTASLAGRYFYEDRWGGEMRWDKRFRGGDEVYGESIYTNRWELLGAYDLPFAEKLRAGFSLTGHDQNSVYGTTIYQAQQNIAFGQLTWDRKFGQHDVLVGTAFRYQYYNDNTPATPHAEKSSISGVFAQDEIALSGRHTLLLGARYDYNDNHGSIFTPRLAYKWKLSEDDVLRVNSGTGFRIVNLFTEDHAALTGAREVIVVGDLKPERSWNANVNYLKKLHLPGGGLLTVETSAWYTYFTNAIRPDYDTDPNQIVYRNLDGHAVTQGLSLNADLVTTWGFKAVVGATYMDVTRTENGNRERQMLTERFSGTWALSYRIPDTYIDIDYTGNLYGPMRLPLGGPLDPRKPESPWWSVQNIQITYGGIKDFEFYFGIKNLLDWTPAKGNPFLIARAHDPFDKNVQYDASGQVIATAENPYALTFDTGYVYGPNQGVRSFGGIRYTFR